MAFLSNFRKPPKEAPPALLSPENLAMWSRVELALNRVRPILHSDGGDIELLDVDGTVITVKLVGACSHCSSSTVTMQQGVELVLREEIPEITEIRLA